MKVAVVSSFFPPWRGGAETYAYNLSKVLVARGHHVTVICASDPLPPSEYQKGSFTVKRLRMLTRLYGTPITPSLCKALLSLDVDVLHGNFPSPSIAFTVAAISAWRRIPAVLTWHNDLPAVTSGARFLIEAHDRLVLPRYIRVYRRIISTSETYVKRSRILASLGESVTVIPNGVDCERFRSGIDTAELRRSLGIGERFVLLFVGALTKWHRYKGLDVLLQALSIVSQTYPDLRLLIVGDGELRHLYRSLSQDLGLDGKVIFVGNVPDDHLPQYYAAADALVLPSKDMSEGFGLTILEANAAGKPVIVSNVGGTPSVVRDGYNGILVPPNDPSALAHAIKRLHEEPEHTREMGRNGRRFAELHDWNVTVAQTESVYRDALQERP